MQGLGGLLSLSRREGVDVRPTLLRVLTDLYVQAASHTADEEAQFTELATRLMATYEVVIELVEGEKPGFLLRHPKPDNRFET